MQRVLSAAVSISGQEVSAIGNGLLLFVGFTHGDNAPMVRDLATKVTNLRIFPSSDGRLQHALNDINGEVLAVPQFTLYAVTTRGRRPDFTQTLDADSASQLFDRFVTELHHLVGGRVATGVFGASMKVLLENDGPFTIMLDREA